MEEVQPKDMQVGQDYYIEKVLPPFTTARDREAAGTLKAKGVGLNAIYNYYTLPFTTAEMKEMGMYKDGYIGGVQKDCLDSETPVVEFKNVVPVLQHPDDVEVKIRDLPKALREFTDEEFELENQQDERERRGQDIFRNRFFTSYMSKRPRGRVTLRSEAPPHCKYGYKFFKINKDKIAQRQAVQQWMNEGLAKAGKEEPGLVKKVVSYVGGKKRKRKTKRKTRRKTRKTKRKSRKRIRKRKTKRRR